MQKNLYDNSSIYIKVRLLHRRINISMQKIYSSTFLMFKIFIISFFVYDQQKQ